MCDDMMGDMMLRYIYGSFPAQQTDLLVAVCHQGGVDQWACDFLQSINILPIGCQVDGLFVPADTLQQQILFSFLFGRHAGDHLHGPRGLALLHQQISDQFCRDLELFLSFLHEDQQFVELFALDQHLYP